MQLLNQLHTQKFQQFLKVSTLCFFSDIYGNPRQGSTSKSRQITVKSKNFFFFFFKTTVKISVFCRAQSVFVFEGSDFTVVTELGRKTWQNACLTSETG